MAASKVAAPNGQRLGRRLDAASAAMLSEHDRRWLGRHDFTHVGLVGPGPGTDVQNAPDRSEGIGDRRRQSGVGPPDLAVAGADRCRSPPAGGAATRTRQRTPPPARSTVQGLSQVGHEIVDVLDPDGQTDEPGIDGQRRVGQDGVRHPSRVFDERLDGSQ